MKDEQSLGPLLEHPFHIGLCTRPSPLLFVSFPFSLIRTVAIGRRGLPGNPGSFYLEICNLSASTQTLFPNKSQSQASEARTWLCLLGATTLRTGTPSPDYVFVCFSVFSVGSASAFMPARGRI